MKYYNDLNAYIANRTKNFLSFEKKTPLGV